MERYTASGTVGLQGGGESAAMFPLVPRTVPGAAVREARVAVDDDGYTHPSDSEMYKQMRGLSC
jgi:hypothetical protein